MNLAKFLLEIDNEYNGHKQSVMKGLTVKQGKKICKALEKYTNQEYSFVLELWTDGCFTIYQKDYWRVGEHPLGDKDRIILACDE